MRQNNEKRHLILKIAGVVLLLFLIFVAVADFTPTPVAVEKTVSYADVQ